MKIDVKKVAKLANIPLSLEEEDKLGEQLEQTLDYVKKLNEIDTARVEPTSQVTGLENVLREDKTSPSLSQEEALKNAKSTYRGYIKVKAILTEQIDDL